VIPENQDSDFKWKEFQDRCNNLCDNLGNLFSRVLNLSLKYNDWQFVWFDDLHNYISWMDSGLQTSIKDFVWQTSTYRDRVLKHLKKCQFREWQAVLLERFSTANKFVNDTKPWELWKEQPEVTAKILNILGRYLVVIGLVMKPYLPYTSQIILNLLVSNTDLDIQTIWNNFNTFQFKKMTEKPDYLFTKVTDEQIETEMAKLQIN